MWSVTALAAVKVLKGAVSRFGVPNRIITDLGTQFTSGVFRSYCAEVGTRVCYASMAHPRSNGQVERANAKVLCGLKTKTFDRLKASGTGWVDQLPSVMCLLQTTASRATGETPFSLVYGAEAVVMVVSQQMSSGT